MLDASESDVDCGGSCTLKCAVNKHCNGLRDCQSSVCDSATCRAAGCTAVNCAYGLTRFILGSNTGTAGQVFVSWDSDSFDVKFTIVDATPQDDSANHWEDDSVELYFDLNNAGTTTFQADDFQIIIPRSAGMPTGIGSANYAAIVVNRTSDANGYTLDISIPWSALNVGASPPLGKIIGFDVAVNDDTGGGTRDSQMMLYGGDQNFNNTALYGDLLLD